MSKWQAGPNFSCLNPHSLLPNLTPQLHATTGSFLHLPHAFLSKNSHSHTSCQERPSTHLCPCISFKACASSVKLSSTLCLKLSLLFKKHCIYSSHSSLPLWNNSQATGLSLQTQRALYTEGIQWTLDERRYEPTAFKVLSMHILHSVYMNLKSINPITQRGYVIKHEFRI